MKIPKPKVAYKVPFKSSSDFLWFAMKVPPNFEKIYFMNSSYKKTFSQDVIKITLWHMKCELNVKRKKYTYLNLLE